MLQHIVLISCCLLAIGDSTDCYYYLLLLLLVTIFLSQPIVATDLVTAQVEDTVTLQPVLPASGLSACPGQDVTLNCTIVRMTTLSGVVLPALTWQYRGDTISYNNPSASSDYYSVQ